MKNRSFVRIRKKAALLGLPLIIATLLSGCGGVKSEAVGLHQTGAVAFMLNCDDAASVYFEKAIAADPEYGPSYIMLGDCYLREGKFRDAVTVINKGLKLELDEGHLRLAHRKLARAYKQLGESEKALEHITIYTRMSVTQEKLTAQKISDTETFVDELALAHGNETISVSEIMEESMQAKAETNSTAQENKEDIDIVNLLTFGLI